MQRVFYLGVKTGFLDVVMKDPSFTQRLGCFDASDPADYFSSPAYQRLNKYFGGRLSSKHMLACGNQEHPIGINHLVISIGADFGKTYTFLNRSSGIVVARCDSLDPISRTWKRWHKIIAVIPPVQHANGKTGEPSNLDGHMLPLMRELQRLAPVWPQSEVTERDCRDGLRLGSDPASVGK